MAILWAYMGTIGCIGSGCLRLLPLTLDSLLYRSLAVSVWDWEPSLVQFFTYMYTIDSPP